MSADIAPGTLCIVVPGRGRVSPYAIGRFVTSGRKLAGVCKCCGDELYIVSADWLESEATAGRSNLRPILPPEPDTEAPIADDVLEEAA